jgi:hypothetical protein
MQRGRKRSCAVRILGHTNPENGQVEGHNVQRVHQGRTRMLLSKMKQNFKFVIISGTAYNNVTGKCLEEDYNINLSMAAVAA